MPAKLAQLRPPQLPRRLARSIRKGLTFLGPIVLLSQAHGCSSLPISYEAQLADHLTTTGAKMYGAYWCPHCAIQKEYFGGAVSRIPYIECDPEGLGAQPELCQSEEIVAYPTWVIEGDRYLGAQPLGKLARLSGFQTSQAAEESKESEESPSGGYSPAP